MTDEQKQLLESKEFEAKVLEIIRDRLSIEAVENCGYYASAASVTINLQLTEDAETHVISFDTFYVE